MTDGAAYSTNSTYTFPYVGANGTTSSSGTGPKAYLNFIMFDRDFNPITTDPTQTNYVRVTTAALEDGTTLPNGVPHELLKSLYNCKAARIFVYLFK